MFCNKREQPRPRSFVILSYQIFGYVVYFTTLPYDNFWTRRFRNLTPSPISLLSIILHDIHKCDDIHLVISRITEQFSKSKTHTHFVRNNKYLSGMAQKTYFTLYIHFLLIATKIKLFHLGKNLCIFCKMFENRFVSLKKLIYFLLKQRYIKSTNFLKSIDLLCRGTRHNVIVSVVTIWMWCSIMPDTHKYTRNIDYILHIISL